ncbi:dynein heavy chain and region D6 of dynein motor-domain-containing protein [Gigaspora rosea]|uniref:Dynein heavy chain, cytoplasmic n=1 Tax=Gigaspora rosea TaxID=44941 RepID=A0A397UWB4_9GLOM|nr:dynein heavy chain and region D6 of dynein motor-domain-containing protein [Gigaspora rosea]
MMIGPSGSGKSMAWKVLLQALERVEGRKSVSYVIDPKVVSKDAFYGNFDQKTSEWKDGLFTYILRNIIKNIHGENFERHWIIFDGDIDPEWIENLNTILDDNRFLTLQNGECLNLPTNVRIIFEVTNIKYAPQTTVNRCGIVLFSSDAVTSEMIYYNYLENLKSIPLYDDKDGPSIHSAENGEETVSPHLSIQCAVSNILSKHMIEDGFVTRSLVQAEKLDHIMDFTYMRVLNTLFSLLNKTVRNVIEYHLQHPDFPMTAEHLERYVTRRLIICVIWSFSGDIKLDYCAKLCNFICEITTVDLPHAQSGLALIDYDVQIRNGEWILWADKVPTNEIENFNLSETEMVVPTINTVRHEEILYSWLSEHKSLLLCGPPGSGKTMTLFSTLKKLSNMKVVCLNFSSITTPDSILKIFDQYCEYHKSINGVILSPITVGCWLVIICSKINHPVTDQYGTQCIISFLRQLIEYGGYWRMSDKAWVKLERIQFVGICNPPTDLGCIPLSHRYLRHNSLIMVNYPDEISFNRIYGTFTRAMLKVIPSLKSYAEPLTASMVEFYLMFKKHFTPDIQAHYIFTPRELTRWMRGIFEVIKPMKFLNVEGLVRIWAHEALRLFQDRLVTEEEKKWVDKNIDYTAIKYFPNLNKSEALCRPILFSEWLSGHYVSVEYEKLHNYVNSHLKVFNKEFDIPLVLFDDFLDHVLRIDRVFRQMQGHLLLMGVSGSGKTTLSRFVAWINGLSVFKINAHSKYTRENFDDDLRTVLRRAGCNGEKICFIVDESNMLTPGFLERMNTLLINAEVPGLFEGDEYNSLIESCKKNIHKDGLILDSSEELYLWFTQQVMKNLHIVFTMNPPEGGLTSRVAAYPALFNHCILDWFGDWSDKTLYQVGMKFTQILDLDFQTYSAPSNFPVVYRLLSLSPSHRSAVINAFVFVYKSLYEVNVKLRKRQGRYNYITPCHYLDFINHYIRLFNEKHEDLKEQKHYLNVGLDKLKIITAVNHLHNDLNINNKELQEKEHEANEKLNQLLEYQRETENIKEESEKIMHTLHVQTNQIERRRLIETSLTNDLTNAELAVEDVKTRVRRITRQHLTEIRSMINPHEIVKMVINSVMIMLGRKTDDWKSVQVFLRNYDDFINNIVTYDVNKMTKNIKEKIKSKYLNIPIELARRASQVLMPLIIWVTEHVRYSDILEKVHSIRKEIENLIDAQKGTQQLLQSRHQMINDLEKKIKTSEDEYAKLIIDKEAIKDRNSRDKFKTHDSLSAEIQKWEINRRVLEVQMETIVGDVLLSAAFLAYGGYFDQQYREILLQKWTKHLLNSNIQVKQEFSVSEYLSSPDDRLTADDLFIENVIILKRFSRYPLIIDPSDQISSFLMNEFSKNKKIIITSFLDNLFFKVLEDAIRSGFLLLVKDAEHFDPILNPVLNKEVRRIGDRVLIRLAGQDIDYSPSFTLFLLTRNPFFNFSPNVCSRVTFVNFVVTRSNLQHQCFNELLKVEQPITNQIRTDLVKTQCKLNMRLRFLEKSLLQVLNESEENVLNDTKTLDTLKKLKQEATQIILMIESMDNYVKETMTQYTRLAHACSSIFFTMSQLNLLHYFYQFSLEYFYEIFQYVLYENPNLRNAIDTDERLKIITRDLFKVTFKRVSRTLLSEDYAIFAILLSQIKFHGFLDQIDETELDVVITHKIKEYMAFPCSSRLNKHINENFDEWEQFKKCYVPEEQMPEFWVTSLPQILIIKYFRPDRIIPAVTAPVYFTFEPGFSTKTESDFRSLVLDEVQHTTPIFLCFVPGNDASYFVDHLAYEVKIKCESVVMDSNEGFALADQAIEVSIKKGNWVLLKNVHLATSWLERLEEMWHSLKSHRNFRLFLTMDMNTKVPVNLLRLSRIFTFEPLPDIRANTEGFLNDKNNSTLN